MESKCCETMTTCGGGRPEHNGVKELVLVVTNPGITLFVRMAVVLKVKPTFLIRCISLFQKVMDQTAVSSPRVFVVGSFFFFLQNCSVSVKQKCSAYVCYRYVC